MLADLANGASGTEYMMHQGRSAPTHGLNAGMSGLEGRKGSRYSCSSLTSSGADSGTNFGVGSDSGSTNGSGSINSSDSKNGSGSTVGLGSKKGSGSITNSGTGTDCKDG